MPSVTYEITATVRSDLCDAFEEYMIKRHIPDLMETEAFVSASIGRTVPGLYRIRYESPSREALDSYLDKHSARLRADFLERFPEGIAVAREEWEIIATF